MPNQLANEISPYLLQHADNPVDWHPWGEEALEKARQEDKPIFLSIGYAACHWCHVMAHESFEDPETAAIMNEHFVNIKVDREQRPDLDGIYMSAVVAIHGHGGWPLNVFLTPDGHPFYGGTYYPPVRRYNLPSFRDVLLSIHNAWINQREQVYQSGDDLVSSIKQQSITQQGVEELKRESLDRAAAVLAQTYDWESGGWGKAPKFPQPMAIEYLLRRAVRGDSLALEMADHALQAMAKGGMCDVLGGGFARYSTDNDWKVPHFEKMLYDNALLGMAYLHAYLVTKKEEYKRVCIATLEFIQRELLGPEGGFYCSLDADSEGVEGKYYTWRLSEIKEVLTDPDDLKLFIAAYNMTDEGNFEGETLLHRALPVQELTDRLKLSELEVTSRLNRAHQMLFTSRQGRVRPALDDKVVTAWNALGLILFSEAARYLDKRYLILATRNAEFVLQLLYRKDQGLVRTWKGGKSQGFAFLDDYAGTVLGLLSLYQSDPDPRWYQAASLLLEEMLANYADPQGGFFDTHAKQESLILRPKDLQDNAIPSGNALAATALLQMAAYTGNSNWYEVARQMLQSVQGLVIRYPLAFSQWLCAFDLAIQPANQIVIVGDASQPSWASMHEVIWSEYRPNLVFAASTSLNTATSTNPVGPPILTGRGAVHNQVTAYYCNDFVCKLPTTDPEALKVQLEQA